MANSYTFAPRQSDIPPLIVAGSCNRAIAATLSFREKMVGFPREHIDTDRGSGTRRFAVRSSIGFDMAQG